MTDEQMDARLRAAGERWRTANTAVAEPSEPSEVEIAGQAQHRRRNWWAIASAAVVVAALVLGGILFARSGGNDHHAAIGIDELTGVTWSDPRSGQTVVFTRDTARVSDVCSDGLYHLRIDGNQLSVDLKRNHAIVAPSLCPGLGHASLNTPQGRRARAREHTEQARVREFYNILAGPATWSVDGKSLTLTRDAVGSIALTTTGTPAPQIVGTRWQLERLTDSQSGEVPDVSHDIYLVISDTDRSFHTSDGCNTLSGGAEVTDATITFTHVAMTQVACGQSAAQDVLVTIYQSGGVAAEINGNQLILSANGDVAIYKAVPGPDSLLSRLLGSWRLETITQSGSQNTTLIESTLTFFRDGKFGFGRACPGFGFEGAVEVGEHSLTLSRIQAATGPVCQTNESLAEEQQDQRVNQVLMTAGTVSWTRSGDQLTIGKNGTQLAFLSAKRSIGTPLVGSWHLDTIEYGGGSSGGGNTATTGATLTFDQNGDYGLSYRCGGKWGKSLVDRTTIHFSGTTVGGADCGLMTGELEEQQRVNAVLSGTASWSLSGRQLTISRSGYQLTFDKTSATHAPTNLIGSWRLKILRHATGGGDGISLGRLTLNLTDKGGFDVAWTCPYYEGKIQVSDKALVFFNIVVAPGPVCGPPNYPAAVQRQDQFVASILHGAVTWRITSDTLTITKVGVGELKFVKTK